MPAAPEHRPVATEDAAAGRRSLLTVAVTTDPVAQPPRKLKKKTVDRVGRALRKAARAAAGAGLVVEVDLGALTAAAGRAATAEPPAGRATPPASASRERPPAPRASKRSAGDRKGAAPADHSDEVARKQTRRTRPGGTAAPVRARASGVPATGDGASDPGGDGESSGTSAAKAPRVPRQSRPVLRRTPARPPQP